MTLIAYFWVVVCTLFKKVFPLAAKVLPITKTIETIKLNTLEIIVLLLVFPSTIFFFPVWIIIQNNKTNAAKTAAKIAKYLTGNNFVKYTKYKRTPDATTCNVKISALDVINRINLFCFIIILHMLVNSRLS